MNSRTRFPSPYYSATVYRDGQPTRCCDREPCHPSLVLDGELSRPVDAGLAKDDRAKTVHPMIVKHMLISRTLQAHTAS
jgi:hypothetical protein